MRNWGSFSFRFLPSYIQGAMAGGLIVVSKFVIYTSNNWEFVYAPAFGMVTGLVLIVAMVMGAQGDRALWEANGGSFFMLREDGAMQAGVSPGARPIFAFWKAFGSCIRVLTIALLLSGIADLVLLNMNVALVEQTRNLRIEQVKNTYMLLGFSNDQIDLAVAEIKSIDFTSIGNTMVEVANKLFVNGLVGLIVALFVRRRKQVHWVDN